MNTYRPRLFPASMLLVAVLLFGLPDRAHAFHVITYYNVGTVGPSATTLCGTLGGPDGATGYTVEAITGVLSSSDGKVCVTPPAGTTLTGNFIILVNNASGSASTEFYGTVAKPTVVAQPKYDVVGVFYAPPCSSGKSANSVVYGSSNELKVDNSLTSEYTQSTTVSLSGQGSFEVDYVPITIAGTLSYGWSASSITGTDVSVTTSDSESYTIDGCTGVDGVNHIYDTIWIWINPVLPYYVPSSTSSPIIVEGIGSDSRDPVTNGSHAPDLITLSVQQIQKLITVLNAKETPTSANTGIEASALQGLERTWDTTWVTNSGGEAGPGLVAADYEDILKADPFVANPSFDPASSKRYAQIEVATFPYQATSTPAEHTYGGVATDAASQTSGTDDQHFVSVEVSVQIGENGPPPSASVKLDTTGKWLWDTKSQATTTNTTTQTATFNIWDPAASYTGGYTMAVYWDTVYKTFVFYPL